MPVLLRFVVLGTLWATMVSAQPASAQPPLQWADTPDTSKYFPTPTRGCLSFVDASAVVYRKEQWLRAIERTAADQPDIVYRWIVGAGPPPTAVLREATTQKDCLIQAMVHSAADPDSNLVLDWWDRTSKKSEMLRVRDRFVNSTSFRKSLIRQISRSAYRDARTQSWIWKRKFTFHSNAFNRVSPRAAQTCKLKAGRTWNPGLGDHKRCWLRVLSFQEREREILVASSAPGISRHHWGTDFDLFSLNPLNFLDGKRLADEYQWLSKNGHQLGFFQPYRNPTSEHQYMEERWHWSYYPIAQALSEFAAQHEADIERHLYEQWDTMEARWNRRRTRPVPYFDYVRERWRGYMFNTNNGLP